MIYKIDDLTLNTISHDIHRGEKEIFLTFTEYNLLVMLMDNENVVLSREKLFATMTQENKDTYQKDSNVVDVYISYLRRKIDKKGKKLIHTVRGYGYKIQSKK